MSRRFEDPSLQGMRVLEVWASENENRRFEIVWEGPRRTVTAVTVSKHNKIQVGGYEVAVWIDKGRRPVVQYYSGRTLLDAALEATRSAE